MSNATTINFSLAESGAVETRNAGQFQYVYIRSASAPFQLSLDGVNFFEAKQNDKYQTTNAAGKHITAKSISGAVIKVVLIHSVSPIVTQDTAVQASAAPTIVVGNFGRVANSPVDGLLALHRFGGQRWGDCVS